jgi:hypothetical protein
LGTKSAGNIPGFPLGNLLYKNSWNTLVKRLS